METEFKFCIPPERLKAVEAAVRRGAVVRTRLQARYFDTADHALAAQGIVLRLRKEGRRWVQTVKAAGGGPLQRLEHNVDLGVARGGNEPVPDPLRHAGTPVGDRLAQALADAGAPLLPTYGTDIWRLTRQVRAEGSTVELALDLGRIVAQPADGSAPREAAVRELELELVRGGVQGLAALARRWAQAHGLWFSTVSKAERGTRLLAGQEAVPAVKASPPRFDAADAADAPSGRAIQRAVVAACLAQILPNASEIAAGSEDAEQIHQLRIGIRRLRTALRELGPLGGPDFAAPAWEPPLVDAFRALGARRDRDEVLVGAQAQLQAAGGPLPALPPDDDSAPSPGAVARASAFQGVLVALIGFAAGDAAADGEGLDADAARTHVRGRLQRLHARTVRDGKRFAALSPDDQHRVRKRLKRLRYLAEFVAPLFDARAAARYLDRLRPAQDALGTYNDEVVALAAYRELAAQDPLAWFAVGWFSGRQPALAQACVKPLHRIGKGPRFWKKNKGKDKGG